MTDHRKPQAFVIEDDKPVTKATRAPKIIFEEEEIHLPATVPHTQERTTPHSFRWLPWLASSLSALLVMWISLQTWQMITGFFAQSAWLGWLASVLGVIAAISLIAIIVREATGLFRLRKLEALQDQAARALNLNDQPAAMATVADLTSLYDNRSDLTLPLQRFRAQNNGIMDSSDRIRLLDRNVLQPLDVQARTIITKRTRRIALLTAVIPAPALDVLLVAAQNFAMLREIAYVYGGKPSSLSTIRLARMVMSHLAIAGGLAMSDSLLQNLIGKGLLGRISSRFGEGTLNGILTARIGVAAMEVCRPIPKDSSSRAELVSVIKEALSFGSTQDANDDKHQS
jgi:putative membrane protein